MTHERISVLSEAEIDVSTEFAMAAAKFARTLSCQTRFNPRGLSPGDYIEWFLDNEVCRQGLIGETRQLLEAQAGTGGDHA